VDFKVWLRTDAEKTFGQESGTLTVESPNATFVGKKRTITMTPVRSVGRRRVGGAWNDWLDLEFDENGQSAHAYITDRRFLGWAGLLGGNEKIASALQSPAAGEPAQTPS
jgi:hypothetical protein